MKITTFITAIVFSNCLYSFCFIFVIHKPLTIGVMKEYFHKKTAYMQKAQGQKFILLAGSNGRFSHRCEIIEKKVGLPCTNMSISADLSLEYQFDKLKPYLNPGDIIYLPLEYESYSGSEEEIFTGSQIPYIAAYDHLYLFDRDLDELIQVLFYFDIKYMISAVGEMILHTAGLKRRYSVDTMTLQGDESQHVLVSGRPYRPYIETLKWHPPDSSAIDLRSFKMARLEKFLRWAAAKNIRVIGGLPTTFDDFFISDKVIAKIESIYKKNGHDFLIMSNQSQYPRKVFYDTSYHLAEEYQITHSLTLSRYLTQMIGKGQE